MPMAAEFNYRFIACPLAFSDELRANPPDEWMKPEDRFDEHVNRSGEIVATPHVAKLVRNHRFKMSVIQVLRDGSRPQKHGTQNPEDAWLQRGFRVHQLRRSRCGMN